MTNDTKRALDIVRPMADLLGITVDADNDFLYVNQQAIGITWNSTSATVKEFLGYMIIHYGHNYRDLELTDAQLDVIRRHWYSDEAVASVKEQRSRVL